LLLPPQLAMVIRQLTASSENSLPHARRLDPPVNIKMAAKVAPKLVVHQFPPSRRAPRGAVVRMVSVVEPLPVIEAGLKLQVLSRGNPEHGAGVKLMVPLYPVWPATVSMAVPLPPGLAIVIDGVAEAKAKSACTVITTAGEVEPV
jgi:hypothetical protein